MGVGEGRGFGLTTLELADVGNIVHEIGNYKLQIQPEGQASFEDMGKYVVLLKKMPDGSLKPQRHLEQQSAS